MSDSANRTPEYVSELPPSHRTHGNEIHEIRCGHDIDGHEVVAVIGEGGFGKVFKVRKSTSGDILALKALRTDKSYGHDTQQRFLRERELLKLDCCPRCVCRYRGEGQYNEKPYFTMEFLEGQTLEEFTHRRTHDESEILNYGLQLATILMHLHEAGFIHRDFSMKNVIVHSHGSCRVLDLGTATGPLPHTHELKRLTW